MCSSSSSLPATEQSNMDEGKQALSDAEQQQLNIEAEVQQAEAQTGTTAIPRTDATSDPVQLDPRFDRVSVCVYLHLCHICMYLKKGVHPSFQGRSSTGKATASRKAAIFTSQDQGSQTKSKEGHTVQEVRREGSRGSND